MTTIDEKLALHGLAECLGSTRGAAGEPPPSAYSGVAALASAHAVQFYDDEEFLFESVGRFVGAGLAGGEGVIVVATAEHLAQLRSTLELRSVDVSRACASQQLVFLDAHETLAAFMVAGRPDRERFFSTVGPVVEASRRGSHHLVRAYGEMVDVLCKDGLHEAAIELERLWNELARLHPLSLLCGYAIQSFARADRETSFLDVCTEHAHVMPAECFSGLADDDARHRRVSLLQQRARALENEVEQRKVVERELRMTLQRLDAVLKQMPSSVAFVSPAGELLLGNQSDETCPTGIRGFREDGTPIQPEEWPVARSITTGEVVRGEEVEVERHDGTRGWLRVSSAPIRDDAGVVIAGVSTYDDITVERAARRKVEAIVEELETANRMKDDFVATVSHELRTPLNAMLGWTRMLRSGLVSEEQREKALEIIERNANAQTQLVEDLLDVSRIISGKMRLDVKRVDVGSVVGNAVEAVRLAASAKGVELSQAVDQAAVIWGDPERVQQVVWNLLSNAVKFTPKGGRVRVEIARSDAFVTVVVTDDGQGIAPEFLPYVFERFRQADAKTTRKHMGLGLGLAIVRQLVELHGGHVAVDSPGLGRGSTFTVRFPSSPIESSMREMPAVRVASARSFVVPSELEGVHVLVLEDEEDARELLVHALGPCGARVSTAATVPEALELVERLRPEVIVSDIGLPGEDGYAFIKRLRAFPANRGGKTPAVALTAYARVEDRTKALVAGFNMHVPKPVEPSELMAVLASLSALFPRALHP